MVHYKLKFLSFPAKIRADFFFPLNPFLKLSEQARLDFHILGVYCIILYMKELVNIPAPLTRKAGVAYDMRMAVEWYFLY